MKKAITFLFLILIQGVYFSYAQDFIIKTKNDTIKCKILHIDDEIVEYQIQNEDIQEKHTLARKYIMDYNISEDRNDSKTNETPQKESFFRLAFAGGYANRLGKLIKSDNNTLNQISKDLKNGYALDAECQYYFNKTYAIGLNINYTNYKGKAKSNIRYQETQEILFIGPAFAILEETKHWLTTCSISLGPLFFTDKIRQSTSDIKGTYTSFGMNLSLGTEYKLTPNQAAGLKISMTGGNIKSININGKKVSLDERMNLSSIMISAYTSFKIK